MDSEIGREAWEGFPQISQMGAQITQMNAVISQMEGVPGENKKLSQERFQGGSSEGHKAFCFFAGK